MGKAALTSFGVLAGAQSGVGRRDAHRPTDDKPLTCQTKTDARMHAEAETDKARSISFAQYAERWIEMIPTQPGRGGKRRTAETGVPYKGKIGGYLVPEFGDTPVREVDVPRMRQMAERLDAIPSPLNPRSSPPTYVAWFPC